MYMCACSSDLRHEPFSECRYAPHLKTMPLPASVRSTTHSMFHANSPIGTAAGSCLDVAHMRILDAVKHLQIAVYQSGFQKRRRRYGQRRGGLLSICTFLREPNGIHRNFSMTPLFLRHLASGDGTVQHTSSSQDSTVIPPT